MFDLILSGGTVYDGSGGGGYPADVGIRDERVAAIGDLTGAEAGETLEATGLAVAPGFIDIHTHSDTSLLVNGRAESQIHQGVTTELAGQCGASAAPSPTFPSFDAYLGALENTVLGVNIASCVGHGAVYGAVLGNALRAPDTDEVGQMTRFVEEALDDGAAGFTTGLEYWPGILAGPEHLVPLAEAAGKRGKLYASHVRNRDTQYDIGFTEAMSTARQARAKLQISHINPKYGAPDYAMAHTLELIDLARARGVDVALDVIPHTFAHTGVVAILPRWAREGGRDDMIRRLEDRTTRARIKANPQPMWLLIRDGVWEDVVLLDAEQNRDLVGATFAEIGRTRGVDPYDAVLDIIIEEQDHLGRLLWTSRSFREEDIGLCLTHPECAVISDTRALAPYGKLKDHIGSLSGYGWAARFLQKYIRDEQVLPLGEAIRRLTSLPASRVGLIDRGRLQPGSFADVCVFDPATIASHCDVKRPRAYASGIEHVLVNGVPAMRDGERTDDDAGRVIREFAAR